MKQLTIEFVRNDENLRTLFSFGFKYNEDGLIYSGRHGCFDCDESIMVFDDNSVDVDLRFTKTLSVLLNLIQMNIFKIIEE